ncbi:MAG TPA: hypothetical protein VGG91_12955 [Myxococcaceae bacterium]
MSPRFRRFALCLVLVSLPAVAGPPREDRRAAARIRSQSPRPEPEVLPSEAAPLAAAAADAGGVDLAGLVGMLTALAVTFGYARGRRPLVARQPSQQDPGLYPTDPP